MGKLSTSELQRSALPRRCYMFAGTSPQSVKDSVLAVYDNVKFHKHDIYEAYIVDKNDEEELLLFQVYGAPLTLDLMHVLKDGGVQEIIFIGYAHGIKSGLEIGDYFIPNETIPEEGVIKSLYGKKSVCPSDNLVSKIKKIFDESKIKYESGISVSVPSVFCAPNIEKFKKDCGALEMEFSSFCYKANEFSMSSAGVFVISDNANETYLVKEEVRYRSVIRAFEIIHNGI